MLVAIMATSLGYGSKNRRPCACAAAHCNATDRLFTFPTRDSARLHLSVRFVNDKVSLTDIVNICSNRNCAAVTVCHGMAVPILFL